MRPLTFSVLVLSFIILIGFCSSDVPYKYETKFIDLPVDHFGFTTNETFKLRYLVSDDYWDASGGPIFFYTGNEGDITLFLENTGFIFDIAPAFSALIVFAEHRYYGQSLPFGNLSFTSPKYLGYLTSSQALADYVELIDFLQKDRRTYQSAERLPVIAFGGSYGGMLASWMRMKYPATIAGAIAASAPIYQFKGLTPCDIFNRIVTQVFRHSLTNVDCSNIVSNSWKVFRKLTDAQKANITKEWKLCSPLKNDGDLTDYLSEAYSSLAMANYPYPASFLGDLPAYPVREFCSLLAPAAKGSDDALIAAFGDAVKLYANYTGKAKCLDIGQTITPALGDKGWGFQACTEIIMPMCSTDSDMFENYPWNFDNYAADCAKEYQVKPLREDLALLEYGGKDIKAASNIVFSNGLLDPWSGGGVLNSPSSSVLAIIIPEGAHHLDLRAANIKDPHSVVEARNFHTMNIRKWLKEYYSDKSMFYDAEPVDYQEIWLNATSYRML